MKKVILLFAGLMLALSLVSCGQESVLITQKDGADGVSCSILDTFLICADGTEFDLTQLIGEDGTDGIDGIDGQDGADGEDGADGIVLYSYTLSCYTCKSIGSGLYAKYSGSKAYVYNNSRCYSYQKVCDGLDGNKYCWVNNNLIMFDKPVLKKLVF